MNHIEMMNLAESVAKQSVCKRAQVGAVVVDRNGRTTTGYNQHNNGKWFCCEGVDGRTLPDVIHAERVAITKSSVLAAGRQVLYVTRQPCIHCARLIAAAGIVKVYYRDADDKDWGLRWLAWHGVAVDSKWIMGQVQAGWADRNGVVSHD